MSVSLSNGHTRQTGSLPVLSLSLSRSPSPSSQRKHNKKLQWTKLMAKIHENQWNASNKVPSVDGNNVAANNNKQGNSGRGGVVVLLLLFAVIVVECNY